MLSVHDTKLVTNTDRYQSLSYPKLVPVEGEDKVQPPLEPFGKSSPFPTKCTSKLIHNSTEHVDPASRADPKLPRLLSESTKTRHLSPYLGTEISGIQISQLSKQGLDELSLYTAQRKVLVFRDQDFADLSPERQIEIVSHFGPLHVHPTAPQIEGFEEYIASEYHVNYVSASLLDIEQSQFSERKVDNPSVLSIVSRNSSAIRSGTQTSHTRGSLLAPPSSGFWTSPKSVATPSSSLKSKPTTAFRLNSRSAWKVSALSILVLPRSSPPAKLEVLLAGSLSSPR